ncbi:DUF2271 domain-containing protein [Novosphingobium mangrovi (ex Huang et al. 2023)]|uniref:DUF2271 domain-containing protein n=1 Tax=Novosphingobium mangrovi (ex Huang et al. 2023) TaxID=2976432 RepID=A0ABT2I0V3_9SPHN|nr:DUF2271 domain-containing protein [Novosphingobium mangrovi (ex Huang et al. 2023)]MCT2398437.1 DUF2271 domain-containing protein [Novosphingobium mangrovi (ex Huang et al. 2023)]
MRTTSLFVLTGSATVAATAASPALADTITIDITIPRLAVAEYHRPYVAVWLEGPGGTARTLSVWYDKDKRGGEGRKWLSDMRTWWRKAGRSASIDGVSGATRAPGPQTLSIPASALRGLPAGQYQLCVEAAREVGGREVVKLPVTLGGAKVAKARASGKSELGTIVSTVTP